MLYPDTFFVPSVAAIFSGPLTARGEVVAPLVSRREGAETVLDSSGSLFFVILHDLVARPVAGFVIHLLAAAR